MHQLSKIEILREMNDLMKKLLELEVESLEELSEKDRALIEKIYTMIQDHKNKRVIIDMKKVITEINYNKLSLPKWVYEYYYKDKK